MRIGYLLQSFPELSETFVAREIAATMPLCDEVHILSLNRPKKPCNHAFVAPLLGSTTYLTAVDNRIKRLALNIRTALTHPVRYSQCKKQCHDADAHWALRLAATIAPSINRLNLDHLHTHFAFDQAEVLMHLSRLLNIPCSVTAHARDIYVSPRLLKEKFSQAKFVATISEYNRKYILASIAPDIADKIHIVHCGIDLSNIPTAHKSHRTQAELVTVARLVPKKGIDLLLQALARLPSPNIRCRIIGDGPQREELEDLAQSLNLKDQVEFLGSQPNEKTLAIVGNADLFILPCRKTPEGDADGIPVAMMEAMAMGVPVLSTHLTGIPELVQPSAGILVEPEDIDALWRAIQAFCDMPDDKRASMAKASQAIVQSHFNIETEAAKLVSLMER
jgi:glycosyltransferase involved in cell wall biosynthesis